MSEIEERQFPVMYTYAERACPSPRSVPWGMLEGCDKRVRANHAGQSLIQIAERGGLSVRELVAVLKGVPFREVASETPERLLAYLDGALKAYRSMHGTEY